MSFDTIVFGKKTFSDILKEIYDNSKSKEKQISEIIGELKPLIENLGDATVLMPLIKELMEIGVKNDEALIKMAGIVQRALSTSTSSNEGFGISDEEKEALLKEINNISIPELPATAVPKQLN
jgi:hypothetical protein